MSCRVASGVAHTWHRNVHSSGVNQGLGELGYLKEGWQLSQISLNIVLNHRKCYVDFSGYSVFAHNVVCLHRSESRTDNGSGECGGAILFLLCRSVISSL